MVHVESTSRRVDVIAEGFDLGDSRALSAARRKRSDHEGAGAEHAAAGGQPATCWPVCACPLVPADLAPCRASTLALPHREHQWCLEGPDGATALVAHQPRLVTDDMIQMRLAALQGVGVVQLPTMMVDKDLADGTLVDVLPAGLPRSGIVHAVVSVTARTAARRARPDRLHWHRSLPNIRRDKSYTSEP